MSRTPRITQPNEFFPLASEEMIRRGAISDAVEHCRRGLIFYPDNISGYAVLANAYLLLEEPTRAANVLRDGFRRTGADRLLELADLIEADRVSASDPTQPVEKPADDPVAAGTLTTADEPGDVEESRTADEPAEESLIPSAVGERLSPVETLSHAGAEEQAADDQDVEQTEPGGLSFITDDPSGPHYVTDPAEEASALYPWGSDERESGDYHQDLTDRMIARSNESIFGNPLGLISRDLFTGEPLPSDRTFFELDKEGERIQNSKFKIKNEDRERGEEGVEKVGGEDTGGVVRPDDPTAGMAAGGGRSDAGELADLIDEDSDRMLDEGGSGGTSGLSLHSGTQISDLRSRNLRLIPGLEYAPLRKDEGSRKIAPLVDEPKRFGMPPLGGTPSPSFSEGSEGMDTQEKSDSSRTDQKGTPPPLSNQGEREGLTPLEELARRLETARIPAVEEEPEEGESSSFEPSLVSDTFAGILVSQGAYAEAIKAYQMLARLKPERREEYEKKIAEIRWQMGRIEN